MGDNVMTNREGGDFDHDTSLWMAPQVMHSEVSWPGENGERKSREVVCKVIPPLDTSIYVLCM